MIRLNGKMRTVLATVLVGCMAVCLLPVTASAAEGDALDLASPAQLTLKVPREMYYEELKAAEEPVTFTVDGYLVAAMTEGGGFAVTDAFASLGEDLAKITVDMSDAEMRTLSEKAEAIAKPAKPKEGEEAAEPVQPTFTVEELPVLGGKIDFNTEDTLDRPLGLYLLVPHSLVYGDYEYSFSSVLLSVPALGDDEDVDTEERPGNEQAGQAHLNWQYNYTAFMKPQRENAKGELFIDKILLNYNQTLGEVMFTFRVTAYRDGQDGEENEIVFSDVFSLVFGAPGTRQILVSGIPLGTRVVVEELSGGSYHLVSDSDQDSPLGEVVVNLDTYDPDQEIHVTFTNEYDDSIIPQYGVVNKFTKTESQTVDGYRWEQAKDNSYEGGEA